jgi:peroxiredoxin
MFGRILRGLMGKNDKTIAKGELVPPFSLKATDGKTLGLKEALGHGPVLAVFFKVSCPTCQFSLPFIERLYQQLRAAGGAGSQVWGVSQDNAENSMRFMKEYGVTFPVLIDPEPYETSQAYGLSYVPTVFLIAPDGRVEMASDGFSKSDLLAIHKKLSERATNKIPPLFQPADRVPEFKPG